jgi:hypothetical protein
MPGLFIAIRNRVTIGAPHEKFPGRDENQHRIVRRRGHRCPRLRRRRLAGCKPEHKGKLQEQARDHF